MSKKRLCKKNIKTKKIKGGNSPLSDLAKQAESSVATKVEGLTSITDKVNNIGSDITDRAINLVPDPTTVISKASDALTNVASTPIPKASDAFTNVASKIEGVASTPIPKGVQAPLTMAKGAVPGVATLGKLGDAYSNLKENIKKLKVPLTQEDKFNHALLKLRTNPQFSDYFTSTINNVLVSEFYKILTQLGEYSKHYSDTVKSVAEKTGLTIVDEDEDFYSDIYSDSSVSEPPKEEDPIDEGEKMNVDKITQDENITEFLEDAMIINVPVIEEIFGKLNKVINEYKNLRRKINALIEKAEIENDAETYFKDFRQLSLKATKLIGSILNEFNADKTSGGEPKIDVVDSFNNSMLYMCIRGRKKFSKLLKLKLYGILNKIIIRLCDIANVKSIINDEEETIPPVLKTQGEPDKIDIGEYENMISDLLKEKQKSQTSTNDEKEKQDLEIVKFQKIVVKIVKKLFCKILKKNDIDSEPFKEIVIPAFKKKQKEFENMVKILEKELNEKEYLIEENKKIGKPVVDTETLNYMKDVKKEMEWAKKNRNSIKEYIKSKKKKAEEEIDRKQKEANEKREAEQKEIDKKQKENIEIFKQKEQEKYNKIQNVNVKAENLINNKFNNQQAELAKRRELYANLKQGNQNPFAGGNLKKLGKKITRKFSSRVSRKTRRHKRTSR